MSFRANKFNARRSPKGVPGHISPLHGPLPTASKAEGRFYAELDQLYAAGLIRWWLPQPPLTVGTDDTGLKRVIYRADALVWTTDNEIVIMDKKGMDTPTSRAKRAAARDRHGLKVVTVYKDAATTLLDA